MACLDKNNIDDFDVDIRQSLNEFFKNSPPTSLGIAY